MSTLLIVINGSGRSGKDSFVDFIKTGSSLINTFCISSVEAVKDAAKILGWDGEKDEAGRKFLSDLKDLSTSAYDGPMTYMKHRIERIGVHSKGNNVIFLMIREPEEIERFCMEFPDNTITVLVRRPNISERYGNHADDGVEGYNYDYIVDNNAGIDKLSDLANEFLATVIAPFFFGGNFKKSGNV